MNGPSELIFGIWWACCIFRKYVMADKNKIQLNTDDDPSFLFLPRQTKCLQEKNQKIPSVHFTTRGNVTGST